jgi:hypothetical protein
MPVNYPCYGCTELIDPALDKYVEHSFDCDMWVYRVKFHGGCYKRWREQQLQMEEARKAAIKPIFRWFW